MIKRLLGCILLGLLLATQLSQTKPAADDQPTIMNWQLDSLPLSTPCVEFSYSSAEIIETPVDKMRDWKYLSLEGLKPTDDRPALLKKIQTLPALTYLGFHSCDLSNFTENDPVPAKVDTVVISGGKISQSTLAWLAKFPSGIEVLFGCDTRGLDFKLGKFSSLTFDNCKVSRSAIAPLVEKNFKVTFKEVEVVDDKK